MMLLPAPEGTCQVCATAHDPKYPHNARSLHYLYRFYGLRGRWPTWADAAAHCSAELVELWKNAMQKKGVDWTEPPEGVELIADPPEESLREPIGDANSPVFGPEHDPSLRAG